MWKNAIKIDVVDNSITFTFHMVNCTNSQHVEFCGGSTSIACEDQVAVNSLLVTANAASEL